MRSRGFFRMYMRHPVEADEREMMYRDMYRNPLREIRRGLVCCGDTCGAVVILSRRPESDRGPSRYECGALPAELRRQRQESGSSLRPMVPLWTGRSVAAVTMWHRAPDVCGTAGPCVFSGVACAAGDEKFICKTKQYYKCL